ncbi:hypothetical protein JNW88_21860 [Micromonospora sp. ATA32]|nr:hypothetical protein [Micromonospora sp. ATA32]
MHPPPAVAGLDQQLRPEFGEQAAGGAQGQAAQGGCRFRAQLPGWVQGQQPEEPGCLGSQGPVGPGEDRLQIGVCVPEAGQPAVGLGQLAGDRGQAEPGPADAAGGDQRQGQRQPAAPRDDLVDDGRVGGPPRRRAGG